MSPGEPFALDGPAGALEARLHPATGDPAFRAVVAHPHPLYGGTMDNAVVVLATRALVAVGAETLRFNFRGVGRSAGEHDQGVGERLDLAAATAAMAARQPPLPLILAGYSFGAVMTLDLLTPQRREEGGGDAAPRPDAVAPAGILLIAPPVTHYEGRDWRLGSIPTAVIYGERDAMTPPAAMAQRAKAWGDAVALHPIPGVGHDLGSFTAPRGLAAALADAIATLAPTSAD